MHTLPKLPYAYDALEPYLDARTVEVHHAKHHQTYVDKLNAALAPHPDLENSPLEELLQNLEEIPETVRGAVRNHGGGHYNHSFFWECLTPESKAPEGEFLQATEKKFGNLETFKKQFGDAAAGVFGSGWAWLTLSSKGGSASGGSELAIMTTQNQDSPLSLGLTPLLGIDVWEHAYYLKYQNRRAEYIEAWWHVVNWREVEKRFGNG